MTGYSCHFCKKTQDQVSLMIAGPVEKSGICDECVEVCMGIVFTHARSKNLVEFPVKADSSEEAEP